MTDTLGWRFPSSDGSDREGINDPMLHTFAGDHERYIARECIQNSVDHRFDPDMPVIVEFRKEDIPREEFPAIDQLAKIIDQCLIADKSPQAQKELKVAKTAICKAVIPTLIVRDSNTEGLRGSDTDEDGSWFRLVRAMGTNARSGVGGGSFGLGKGAPFAASEFRTVFYSTLNQDHELIFQGKTKLVSHKSADGDLKRAQGNYGAIVPSDCISLRSSGLIPARFLKTSQGTDIIIPAYKEVSDDWSEGLVHSVLRNFWPAIHKGMLEVKIYDNGKLKDEITAENLELYLEINNNDATAFAYYFYQAKTAPDANGYFKEELEHLGEVELYVKKGEDFPKKVQQMRSPHMVVSDESYKRTLLDPYAAVLICNDDLGNEFLKELEPPAHDRWDYTLGEDNRLSKRVLKQLQDWVRDCLKSMSETAENETAEIPGLAQYLANMERDDTMPLGRAGKSTDPESRETHLQRPIAQDSSTPAKRATAYSIEAIKADKGSNSGGGPGGGGGGSRGSGGGSTNPRGKNHAQRSSSIQVRNLGVNDGQDYTDFELCLYSVEDFDGSVRVLAAGEDSNSGLYVLEAHSTVTGVAYPVKRGRVFGVKIQPGRPARIRIRIDGTEHRYALGVEAYEIAA